MTLHLRYLLVTQSQGNYVVRLCMSELGLAWNPLSNPSWPQTVFFVCLYLLVLGLKASTSMPSKRILLLLVKIKNIVAVY